MVENTGRRTTPGRVARGLAGLLAIAAIVGGAVAAGLAIFPRLRGEPKPTLDPDLVAVAPLENRTGDVSLDPLGRQAAARITEAVQLSGVAEIIAADLALSVAEKDGGLGELEAVKALAGASGAGIVVHGSYYFVGDSLQIQLQIADVATGELMGTLMPVMAPRDRPDGTMTVIRQRTVGALAAALDYRNGELDFSTQPPSLEAYRLYRQGLEAWDRGEYEEALGHFQQARALDTTWVSPLYYVSLTFGNLNRYAEMDSTVRVAERFRNTMSEPEYLLINSLSSHADDEDPTVKLRNVRRLAEIAPRIGLRWGYWAAYQAHRPREALGFLARIDTTSPRFERTEHEYWSLLARQHHLLGQHEKELEVAREARRRFPDHMAMLDAHLTALAALGRTAEIEALLDTVFALPGTQYQNLNLVPSWRALNTAAELRAHGHSDSARRAVLERGLAWLEDRPPEARRQMESDTARAKANFLYAFGRWEDARELYELLYDERAEYMERREEWPQGGLHRLHVVDARELMPGLAGAAARLGDPDRARAISAELADSLKVNLDRAPADPLVVYLLVGQARIAAALGEREEAVRLLQESFRLSRHKGNDVFHAHRWDEFETLHDYPPYQQFLKPRG